MGRSKQRACGSVSATAPLTSIAASLVLVGVLAMAAPAIARRDGVTTAGARAARLGPPPVPCSPAPCGQGGQPSLPAGQLEESTKVHFTITPHVVHAGQVMKMRVTYSGDGHCDPRHSTCFPLLGQAELGAPGDAEVTGFIRVDCNRPNPAHPITTWTDGATTQCYVVDQADAHFYFGQYTIIRAPIGNCGAPNGVFDCESDDYVLIEPACKGLCPLKVNVKTFGSDTAGLGYDKSQSPGVPEFLKPGTNGLAEGRCLSGCTNVQVTVTDKQTGAPVAGARLSASVTSFPPGAIAPYPKGFDSGDGHLCRASSFSTCGAGRFITDIPTDANGQATYLYWAPGATSQHTVKITVKAQKACRTCSKGRQTGGNTHELKISPHVIYKSQATLGHEALDTLELWAKNDKNFESILRQPVNAFAEHELENAIKAIAEFYATEAALPVVLALEAGHKLLTAPGEYADLSTELGQEEAFTALFANPLGLATAGLGGVDAGELDQRFLDTIAGKDGMLRRWGLVSDKIRGPVLAETMKLSISEVSYCGVRENCGPGDSTPGIEPFLFFDFRAGVPSSQPTGERTIFTDQFVLPYDASFYDLLQFNGKGPP